jgi:FtsZ-interacting cell division protein YlmF
MRFPVQVNPGAVKVIAPRYFEDEQYIADQVLAGCVVIVDFKYLDLNIKQRIISFLERTLFGIDGKMIILREDLVLLLPQNALAENEVRLAEINTQPQPEPGNTQNFNKLAMENY